MDYTYKAIWDNARLFGLWLVTLVGAFQNQMINQMANQQLVHLKVLS